MSNSEQIVGLRLIRVQEVSLRSISGDNKMSDGEQKKSRFKATEENDSAPPGIEKLKTCGGEKIHCG